MSSPKEAISVGNMRNMRINHGMECVPNWETTWGNSEWSTHPMQINVYGYGEGPKTLCKEASDWANDWVNGEYKVYKSFKWPDKNLR